MRRSNLLIPTVLAAAMAVISAPSSASLISSHNFYKDGVLYKSSAAPRSNSKRPKNAPQVVASIPVNCAPPAASSPPPAARSSKAKSSKAKSSKAMSSKRLQNVYTYDRGTGSYTLTRVAKSNTGPVKAAAAQPATTPCLESPPAGEIGAPGLAGPGSNPDVPQDFLDEIFAPPTGQPGVPGLPGLPPGLADMPILPPGLAEMPILPPGLVGMPEHPEHPEHPGHPGHPGGSFIPPIDLSDLPIDLSDLPVGPFITSVNPGDSNDPPDQSPAMFGAPDTLANGTVPEPGTLPLLAIGVAAALYIARRGKK